MKNLKVTTAVFCTAAFALLATTTTFGQHRGGNGHYYGHGVSTNQTRHNVKRHIIRRGSAHHAYHTRRARRLSDTHRQMALALAQSNDFSQVLSIRTRRALETRPTERLLNASLRMVANEIKENQPELSDESIISALMIMLTAHEHPQETAAVLASHALGCFASMDCVDLGESILEASTLVQTTCMERGHDDLGECIRDAESPSIFLVETVNAAILEHMKAVQRAEQLYTDGGLSQMTAGGSSGPGGGLGLIPSCSGVEAIGNDSLLDSPEVGVDQDADPLFEGLCEQFAPSGTPDFGPNGDPQYQMANLPRAGRFGNIPQEVTTTVSPFLDHQSPCFGLNPAKLYTSDSSVGLPVVAPLVAVALVGTGTAGVVAGAGEIADAFKDKSDVGVIDAMVVVAKVGEMVASKYTAISSGMKSTAEGVKQLAETVTENVAEGVTSVIEDNISDGELLINQLKKDADQISTDIADYYHELINGQFGANQTADVFSDQASLCVDQLGSDFPFCGPVDGDDPEDSMGHDGSSSFGDVDEHEGSEEDFEACGIEVICGGPIAGDLAIYASLCGAWDPDPTARTSQRHRAIGLGGLAHTPECPYPGHPSCDDEDPMTGGEEGIWIECLPSDPDCCEPNDPTCD